MKLIVEGVMSGNLPWNLVFIGIFLSVTAEILKIPPLPFAIGIYLPVNLSACITIGALIRYFLERNKDTKKVELRVNRGILFCSGLIAGEGLIGILLALLAVFGFDRMIDLSSKLAISPFISSLGGGVLFLIIILTIIIFSMKGKNAHEKQKLS